PRLCCAVRRARYEDRAQRDLGPAREAAVAARAWRSRKPVCRAGHVRIVEQRGWREAGMIVVQLSDPHIVEPGKSPRTPRGWGPVDRAASRRRAAAAVTRLDPLPDIAVVTGDLVDAGAPAEYEHLRHLLAPLHMPVFVIPGNHDARDPLRAAFGADGYPS